jgi:5'-phosphate synthase pdxT subunit
LVTILTIGVLCIQGAVSEHHHIITETFSEMGISGKAINIRKKEELHTIDAMIIPGGESTTISRILYNSGMYEILKARIEENDIAIMGTCAGCVLLSEKLSNPPNLGKIHLLNAMEMEVERNAYGRQRESFEHLITIIGIDKPFNAVFIRAPIIKNVWKGCKAIGKIDRDIIAAKQDRYLALSFHPELTNDTRLHQFFIEMI